MITVSASGVFANYLTFQSPPNTSHFLWSVLLPTTSCVLYSNTCSQTNTFFISYVEHIGDTLVKQTLCSDKHGYNPPPLLHHLVSPQNGLKKKKAAVSVLLRCNFLFSQCFALFAVLSRFCYRTSIFFVIFF